MKRIIFGAEIRKHHTLNIYSATDLIRGGNIIRSKQSKGVFNLTQYLSSKHACKLITAIEKKGESPLEKSKGCHSQTFVHPLLLLDISLKIDINFNVIKHKWLLNLIINKDEIEFSYFDSMKVAIIDNNKIIGRDKKTLAYVKYMINERLGITSDEHITANQKYARELIYLYIAKKATVIKDIDTLINLAFLENL